MKRLTKLKKSLLKKKALALCTLTAGAMLLGSGTASAADVYGAQKPGFNDTTGSATAEDSAYTVSDQTVTISSGTNDNVYGGYIYADTTSYEASAGNGRGIASSNTVTISGGTSSCVYGGAVYRGAVNNNTVTVTSGSVSKEIYGGMMEQTANTPAGNEGTANNNTVTITGGTIGGELTSTNAPKIYGAYSRHTNTGVNGNLVAIGNATSTVSVSVKEIYGGYANDRGAATGNKVEIKGGTVTVGNGSIAGSVIGGNATGFVDGATVILKDNSVTMNTGTVFGSVYGGVVTSNKYKDSGVTGELKSVSGNTVSLSMAAKVTAKESTDGKDTGSVGGAKIDGTSGNVYENTVAIDGASVQATIFGAQAGDSTQVKYNTVTISNNATIAAKDIYGANITGSAAGLNNNSVSIDKSTVSATGGIYGAKLSANVASLEITDTTGIASNTAALTNINGDLSIGGDIVGVEVKNSTGTMAIAGDVTGNKVTIQNTGAIAKIGSIYGANVEAATITVGNVNNNTVSITDIKGSLAVSNTAWNIMGARISGLNSSGAAGANKEIKNNSVTITAPVERDYTSAASGQEVIGAYVAASATGTINNYTVSNNSVSLTNTGSNAEVVLARNVTGARVSVNAGSNNIVSGNTVEISSVKIEKNVSGGEMYGSGGTDNKVIDNTVTIVNSKIAGNVLGGICQAGTATGNTVTFGNATTSGHVTVGGSVYLNATGAFDSPTGAPGGTLTVYNSGNTVGGNLYAFSDGEQKATLNFYFNPTDSSNVMLNVTGTAKVTGATINAVVRNVGYVAQGSKITLLTAGTLEADDISSDSKSILTDGFVDAEFAITKEGKSIIATAGKAVGTAPTSKSPVETMAASLTLLNAGADMVAGESFSNAAAAVAASQAEGASSAMAPFASIGGSSMRVESGSYCDVKAWNVNVGFAKAVTNKKGRLMFGPLIEYGKGSYDSYLDDGTHGSGDSRFTGIGFMAKQSNEDGLYYEGSLRGGRTKSDYSSNFVAGGVTYDTSAPYYAAHVGVGKVQPAGKDGDTIDYYGKLFYSR